MAVSNDLVERSAAAGAEAVRFEMRRSPYERLASAEEDRIIGLIGPRGGGKSVLLKQLLAAREDAFYIALDSLGDRDLFDTAQQLQLQRGIKLLLLDEAIYLRDFDAALKQIDDSLDMQVVFTSSAALTVQHSPFDFMRRSRMLSLPLLSFREFVASRTGMWPPLLTMDRILAGEWGADSSNHSVLFDEYLQGGIAPRFLEEPDSLPWLRKSLNTVLCNDLPRLARLPLDEVDVIRRMVDFIGRSEADDISSSRLSRSLGITKYKAGIYLGLLKKAFVVHLIHPRGSGVLKEPKILMTAPYRLLYRPVSEAAEALHQDFFATMMAAAGIPYFYLKSTRGAKTPNFLVSLRSGEVVVEIKGKGRGIRRFKGIKAEKRAVFSRSGGKEAKGLQRPLFLLGMLT